MKASICLSMIVKNEAPVILRCLKTIKPWINTWVISDTGSTDGTQSLIQEFMKDIPGELIETPWVDFAYNRNIALEASRKRADYSLFMDADQQFIPLEEFQGFQAIQDCYSIHVREPTEFGSMSMAYFLLCNRTPIFWKGVLHEYLSAPEGPEAITGQIFAGGSILSLTADGHRSSDPRKYLKDAEVLLEALKKEPDNARYMFYLGQSYMNANDEAAALDAFEKRSHLESTDLGEKFSTLFLIGLLQEKLNFDEDTCLESFKRSHEAFPKRQEPAYKVAQIYIKRKEYQEAYDLLKRFAFVYDLEDQYSVQTKIQNFLLPILFAQACYLLKKYEECYNVLKKVQTLESLEDHLKKQIKTDLCYLKTQIPYLN